MRVLAASLGAMLAAVCAVGACGLEIGGPNADPDSSFPDMPDGSSSDVAVDVPVDMMTPDLGTGETGDGGQCTCTPPLPSGWQFVVYDGMARPACPSSYAQPLDTLESPMAAATQCACGCSGLQTQPTCSGDVTFAYGFGANTCTTFTGNVICGSACRSASVSHSGSSNDFANLSVSGTVPAAGGACNAAGMTVNKPAPTSLQGRSCTLQVMPTMCGQNPCVPTPTAGYTVCVAKLGPNMCPAGFPNPHSVGDGINDTRSCGPDTCACTLAKGTCTTPQVRLYWGSNNCSGNEWSGGPRTANGTCVSTGYGGSAGGIQSCQYTSAPSGNASCTFSGNFTPQGGLALTNVQTICCL